MAALALAGGGAGVAFAGDAPAGDAGTTHSSDSGDGGSQGSSGTTHTTPSSFHKSSSCSIKIVDPAIHGVDGATNLGVAHTIAPVHQVICPPVNQVLTTAGF